MKKNVNPKKGKQEQPSEKKYFGLSIHNRKFSDEALMHFGSRLFLCANISSDHAKHFVERFEDGLLSVNLSTS